MLLFPCINFWLDAIAITRRLPYLNGIITAATQSRLELSMSAQYVQMNGMASILPY